MNGKNDKLRLSAAILILAVCGGISWGVMRAAPAAQGSTLNEAAREKVLRYIRERFGVADSVKLTMGPLATSPVAPDFDEATITVDDGKSQHPQKVLISKDARLLIVVMGNIVDLHQNSAAEMAQRVQEAFKTPPSLRISVGGFKHSPSPDFEEGTLVMDDGRTKQDRTVLLSRDGRHLIVSEMYSLGVNPRVEALRNISLRDEPSQGPADAPVTIVEYADLECPTCARMQEFFETKVVPRYGKKVRIVFKEFPLVAIHDWSLTAAIACQCAYEISPASYVPLRTAIFRNQQFINITNLRDTLLSYGEQAGVNRVQLAGCLDAKSSYPRIERDVAEAKRIGVNQTPTVFINGRMLVGLPSDEAYYDAIDAALGGAK